MRRVEYRWIILAAGFAVLFFSGGSRFAFGLVLKPMSDDLGWSRSSLSLVVTIFMLVSALAMPIVGRLIDRYSLRVIVGSAALAAAVAIGLMGRVTAQWQMFALYGGLYAIGSAGTSITVINVMISRWFRRRTGTAGSVAISGNAIGQLVIITALASVLASMGWRSSFTVLGVANLVAVPLVLLAVRSGPRSLSADATAISEAKHALGESAPGPMAGVLGSHQLWLLIGVYAICGFQDFFVATHVVAFARDQEVGAILAGNLLALMGLTGLVGLLLSGVLADTFGPTRPTVLCFLMRVGVFALIAYAQSTAAIVAFGLLYGLTFFITAPLGVLFVDNMFGRARLATISGTINMVHQVCGGLGALAGAVIFDRWDSYERAFVLMLALSVLATTMTLRIRDRTPAISPA